MNNDRFLNDFVNLITKKAASHMGMHLYAAHGAVRSDGVNMSGSLLWEELAKEKTYKISRADTQYFHENIDRLKKLIPPHLPLIELGGGAETSIKTKTIPLIEALKSAEYCPVEGSEAFAKTAVDLVAKHCKKIPCNLIVGDIFEPSKSPKEEAVTFFGGSTISNIIHPISKVSPELELTKALKNVTSHARNGWIIISFDSTQKEKDLTTTYSSRAYHDLILNIMFRAKKEFSPTNFDPELFKSTPIWIKESGQWAHVLEATHAQNFVLQNQTFGIKKNQRFHIVNSYKFSVDLFNNAARKCGLEIIHNEKSTETGMAMAILKKSNLHSHDLH